MGDVGAEREISFQPLLSALCLIELAIEVAKVSQRRPPRYFPLSAKSIPIPVGPMLPKRWPLPVNRSGPWWWGCRRQKGNTFYPKWSREGA